jgi:hypothetical protein
MEAGQAFAEDFADAVALLTEARAEVEGRGAAEVQRVLDDERLVEVVFAFESLSGALWEASPLLVRRDRRPPSASGRTRP